MREIVDKHFADNWVISFFLGYTGAPFALAKPSARYTV
jgi:hypothetical protein